MHINNSFKEIFKHLPENSNVILACKHFQNKGHNLNKHANFIIIDKLVNVEHSKSTQRDRLTETETFWIKKLETLHPQGLNETNETSR